jgi:intracellular sulfur oxidation DsrE/DsrF family protein
MSFVKRLVAVVLLIAGGYALSGNAVAGEAAKPRERVVLQVSDDSAKTWNQALNVVENLQVAYGKDNIEIEVVAFGLGIGMLRFDSVSGSRVRDAAQSGAHIIACENTMRRQKLGKDDMLDSLRFVPAGIVQIIERQKQGWTVIRP